MTPPVTARPVMQSSHEHVNMRTAETGCPVYRPGPHICKQLQDVICPHIHEKAIVCSVQCNRECRDQLYARFQGTR